MNNHTPSASDDALQRSAQLCKEPDEVSQQRKGRPMTIIITKTKLALGILAMVLVGATVAAASDGVFTDNPSGTYYHDPVEWAYDNGITTGTSATTFSPMDSVTRGQNVTFAYRYDQNVVQPALEVLEAGPEISHFLYRTSHADNSDGDHEQIRDLVELSKKVRTPISSLRSLVTGWMASTATGHYGWMAQRLKATRHVGPHPAGANVQYESGLLHPRRVHRTRSRRSHARTLARQCNRMRTTRTSATASWRWKSRALLKAGRSA